MKYIHKFTENQKYIWHVCSPESLLNIIFSEKFTPTFTGDHGADSGLNCISQETKHVWNSLRGDGVILHLSWSGNIALVDDQYPLPYPKNILLIFKDWRAFIPIRSDPTLVKIVGFEFKNEQSLKSLFNRKSPLLSSIPAISSLAFLIWKKMLFSKLKRIIDKSQGLIIDT